MNPRKKKVAIYTEVPRPRRGQTVPAASNLNMQPWKVKKSRKRDFEQCFLLVITNLVLCDEKFQLCGFIWSCYCYLVPWFFTFQLGTTEEEEFCVKYPVPMLTRFLVTLWRSMSAVYVSEFYKKNSKPFFSLQEFLKFLSVQQ